MYLKDKANRITLRLNDEQMGFVVEQAEALGVSPSELLRMVINVTMVSTVKAAQSVREGVRRANEQTDSNDKL